MYDSPIRAVSDAIIAKHGLNGPRKSWACDKAPNRHHGLHQLCVDRENEPWFYCNCKCHQGRITTIRVADPATTNTGGNRNMAALYTNEDRVLCKSHLTGEPKKAGRPPRAIDKDGIRWTHIDKDTIGVFACADCG